MPGNPFDNIPTLSAIYDDDEGIQQLVDSGQLTTASNINRPEPTAEVQKINLFNNFMYRNPKAGGGMLVKPSADGSRPGYAKDFAKEEGFTKLQQEKIKRAFPEIKFDFSKHKYGVKKYPTGDFNKTNKDFLKVKSFVKKGFNLEMGEGLSTRGVPYSDRGKRLSLKDQEKIKSLFELPPGEEWDFKTHKYGIKQAGRENLLVRMARAVKDKKPWKVAADFGTPEGWMIIQMNRVFENEKKAGIKNLTYQPVYKKINGIQRIIGFKDNTAAGGGKYYYGLKIHSKKNATSLTKHGDYKLNKKLVDISKRAYSEPNEVITGILKKKGFDGQVTLNQLINFLSGTEAGSKENLKNAIVRHHNSGVAYGSATNDLSLTTQAINQKIKEAEKRIRTGNILSEDVQLLKNNNIFVRGKDGILYGGGAKTPIGQFKQIEKSVQSAVESPKFKVKDLKNFLENIQKGNIEGVKKTLEKTGVKNAGFISRELLESAAKGIGNVGRVLSKYGILPEAGFLGAEYLIRTQLGDSPKESFLRTTDFVRPGDQTKEAEILETSRFFGDKAGQLVGRVIDYEKQLAKIESLKQQKQSLESLSPSSGFGYIADTSQDVKNIDNQLQQAISDLNNKFNVTEAERTYANRLRDETDDARMATSDDAKTKLERSQSPSYRMSAPQAMRDMRSQMDLNLDMLPRPATIAILDPEKGIRLKNLSESSFGDIQNYRELLKGFDVEPPSSKIFLDERNRLRGMLPSEAAEEFGAEQTYGAEGTFFGQPLAGGGIAKIAGIDQGPQITSMNPDSGGLKGILKRAMKLKE